MNAFDRGRLGGSVSCVNDSGARPSVSRAQFRPACPSGSLRGGRGLGVPDEILGITGRNRAIDAATGRHFSFGTLNSAIGGPIDTPTGDVLTKLLHEILRTERDLVNINCLERATCLPYI